MWGYIGVALLLVMVTYQYFLLLVYSFTKDKKAVSRTNSSNFIILIPAHNEELLLPVTLESLAKIEYPKEKFKTVVIADNCTDGTVKVAKSMGVEFLVRNDREKMGKGYALEWAFQRLSVKDVDAIVIIDADCSVSKNILSVFDYYLDQGFKAVQSANLVSKKQEGPFNFFFALGNVIKNYFVYFPKFKLGSSAFLLGTGMCIHPSILSLYFRPQYSVSEDIQFSLKLIEKEIRIAFAVEARVETVYPESIRGASVQRIRWSSGTFALIRKYIPFFLWKGVISQRLVYIDTALTLLTWSKILIALTFILTWISSFWGNTWMWALLGMLTILEVSYVCLGAVLLVKSGYRYRPSFGSLLLAFWFLFISILGLMGVRKDRWQRTNRS